MCNSLSTRIVGLLGTSPSPVDCHIYETATIFAFDGAHGSHSTIFSSKTGLPKLYNALRYISSDKTLMLGVLDGHRAVEIGFQQDRQEVPA